MIVDDYIVYGSGVNKSQWQKPRLFILMSYSISDFVTLDLLPRRIVDGFISDRFPSDS